MDIYVIPIIFTIGYNFCDFLRMIQDDEVLSKLGQHLQERTFSEGSQPLFRREAEMKMVKWLLKVYPLTWL